MKSAEKQTIYHFSYLILVESSLEKVWEFLTNVEQWSEWDVELNSARLSENFALGVIGVLTPKKGQG